MSCHWFFGEGADPHLTPLQGAQSQIQYLKYSITSVKYRGKIILVQQYKLKCHHINVHKTDTQLLMAIKMNLCSRSFIRDLEIKRISVIGEILLIEQQLFMCSFCQHLICSFSPALHSATLCFLQTPDSCY